MFPGTKDRAHLVGLQKIWPRLRNRADLSPNSVADAANRQHQGGFSGFPCGNRAQYCLFGHNGQNCIWQHGESDEETLTAKDAKYGFGRLIDLARAEPVTVAKHGRPVVVVMAVEEFERLKTLDLSATAPAAKREATK